jgi:AraC family transcriptional regulator of adaptative response/methylated-DNA-[protein]-cysteine methyltransferase
VQESDSGILGRSVSLATMNQALNHKHSMATRTMINRAPNARRWQAVLDRDARMDRKFVYGVRSTGIYCRPSCPSRRPGRAQVSFFPLPGAAEKAGFRPCLRCKPNGKQAPDLDTDAGSVARLCREIELQVEQDSERSVRLTELAAKAGTSTHQLHRLFRRVIGITPRQFVDALRIHRLKGRLKSGDDVTTALYEAGYGSASRLYERAYEHLGMTPATYKQGGRGMEIVYTIEKCPLGRVLVAATARGVSAVYLGDTDQPLERALRKEYPNAAIRHDASALGSWVKPIIKHLSGGERRLDLPTDVEATAFQRRVWEELRKIPYGATRTYSQIARALGQPTASRAVARACATNPVSIVVPCHRVVRGDGHLAGYRWGIRRKQALLEQERGAIR